MEPHCTPFHPPVHTNTDDAPPDVDFVHPGLNVIGTGAQGMAGFDTYQLTVSFESTDVDSGDSIRVASPFPVSSAESLWSPAPRTVYQQRRPFAELKIHIISRSAQGGAKI